MTVLPPAMDGHLTTRFNNRRATKHLTTELLTFSLLIMYSARKAWLLPPCWCLLCGHKPVQVFAFRKAKCARGHPKTLGSNIPISRTVQSKFRGSTGWRSGLRHYATSRKVAGSIFDGVIGIFHCHNPSGRTMALGLTQPLKEKSTRNISCGVKAAGA